jgi:hypothetical protein
MATESRPLTADEREFLDRIGHLLLVRQYNRRCLPVQSGAVELSPIEFVFVSVYEFNRQLFINGFDGFVHNTDGEYTDFLPVALAAVGAPRYALLVRQAWEQRADTEGRFDSRFFEMIHEEDLDHLLLAYARRHKRDLPDPGLATPDFYARWEEDKRRWWDEKNRAADAGPSP